MTGIYNKFTFFVFFSLVGWLNAFANLPEQYRFSVLDIHNGLTHNQVNCFLKDKSGYMWIGTAAGLNRFDGNQLKVFRHDAHDTSSISGNEIYSIFEDPEGYIWIGTNKGVNLYDPKKETFNKNWEDLVKQYALPGTSVEDIFKDKEGNYWFVQTGFGVTRYDPSRKESRTLKHSFLGNETISSNYISDIQEDDEGHIWLLHRNGILEKLDKIHLQVVEQYDYLYQKFNHQLLGYEFTVDSDNDLWIYLPSDGKGVLWFNSKEKTFSQWHQNAPRLKINSNLVTGVVEESAGIIWVGTDLGGINVINKKDFTVRHILHNNENKNSLVHNSIYSLYKDSEGIIWVGAYKNGVNYYHKDIIRFNYYKNFAAIKESLPYDDVNRFVEDEKGNLWIGTNGGGLLYLNRTTGKFTQYKHDPQNEHSISSDVIVSLLISKDKSLWIGTYFGGLNKFDGKKFTHYRNDPQDPNSLSNDNIWELLEDSSGNIWVGTISNGIDLFDPKTNTFLNYMPETSGRSIVNSYISAVCEDGKGRIWVGGNEGIDVIDRATGKIMHYQNEPNQENSLISNTILWIHNDSKNNIWVATEEGLAYFDEETQSFQHYTEKDGLPHHAVLTILEDDDHNLWCSTPNGLSNLVFSVDNDPSKVIFRNYDESDGLQGMVFNENAALKLSTGELVFGGSNGFNMFDPNSLEMNTIAPDVIFTDFQLFNHSLAIGEKVKGRTILSNALSQTDHITLAHNQNFFSIEFSSICFFQPEKNRYKYKLIGFDESWHEGDNNSRKVTYTNLDPGNYEFQVLASNNDGLWNGNGSSLKITVLAPFWKTPEAYLLYAFFILACLYLGRRIMLQKERVKFQIEQERREARQLHELDLMKIRFFTNVSHEFRTPLTLILTPIEKLLGQIGEEESTYRKQYIMIQRNAKRLLNLVNQLLDFRKIEVEGVKLHTSEGNIIAFIEESVHSFSDLSEKQNISLTFHTDVEALHTSFDMDKVEKILFNLLSNAFKFTSENGNITVNVHYNGSLKSDAKILTIQVKDDGIGIPKEKQDKIFQRFFRNDMPSSLVNQGSGIGLSITKEFVRIHGGEITVQSEPDKGSCFTVTLPIMPIKGVVEEKGKRLPEKVQEEKNTKILLNQHYPHNRKKPKILLVEDNEDFRFYLKDNLGVHFEVTEAKNGKEGWQKLLANMPELVVSDLMMPEMNGMELCKKVKADPRTSHIPFVLLTAHTAEEQKLKGLNIGANDYMTKPFNFEILLSRIKNLINERQQLQKVLEKKISVETSQIDIVSLDDKLIQDAIRIVEENMAEPHFSVEILSKELGMSRANLYKRMVSLTGQSPVEFIRKIRLQRAAQLLDKSQLTVAEIAYQVGFNSTKYFTKYFKREFNVLPSLYASSRKKMEDA